MGAKSLSSMEIDAIGEILNISLGASATAVSTMLDARVDITTPIVQVRSKEEFEFTNLEPAVGVEITYVDGLTGSNLMLLKRGDVKVIVEMLMGMEIDDDEFELNEMNISAICEVMNQMMGASSTALSELLSKTVNISTPVSFEVESTEQFKDKYFEPDYPMVVIGFTLSIADKLESEFMNLMQIDLAKELVAGFFPDGVPDAEPAVADPVPEAPVQEESAGGSDAPMSEEEIQKALALYASEPQEVAPVPQEVPVVQAAEPQPVPVQQVPVQQVPVQPVPQATPQVQPMAAVPVAQMVPSAQDGALVQQMTQMMEMMQKQMQMQQQQMQQMQSAPKQIQVQSVPQPNLMDDSLEITPEANMDLIMGVSLEVSVEIGRTKKLVKDILDFNKGTLVVLDKLAGEQVDLFVNGQCIAKGDVVVVEDNFGIRITEILQEKLVLGE